MKNLRTFVLFTVGVILGCYALSVTASAIPMWEFLSRDEKMSHLFRVFSQQVAKFCVDSSMPDCNKNLLVSGFQNLANMDDNILDKLDPYQRGAKEIIWRAIVKNGYSTRNSHDSDESYFTTGTDSLATSDSDTNGLGEETIAGHDYFRPPSEHTGPYLVGPMVIRVYPDGRPVPEDSTRPLPRDEDIEEFKHSRVPSIEDIEANRDVFYEKRSKGNVFSEMKDHRRIQDESVRLRNDHPPFKRRLLQEVVAKRKIRYY
ncbi:Rhythmically expressed gene 5 protein [Habropoda laboriosa]|uniref:Rhythmically expressed gene 5 protein n=1 Tax=Habropoda laboriosa TaxID=597456 RepID=A0A0L7QXC2_9HYME|nr:PREDICTED: rhythmically expressed gene 5 protein [Habropoda laboriosa]KOC63211.1 Rhythmically expressed gene 5 protein [Habropoda laboriosa]